MRNRRSSRQPATGASGRRLRFKYLKYIVSLGVEVNDEDVINVISFSQAPWLKNTLTSIQI